MTDGPHTSLDQRIQGWRQEEHEADLESLLAWVLFELFPSEESREMVVKSLARLETARAALDVLT